MSHTPIPTRTVYLDTETGGLRPTDRPWELALVIDDAENMTHERHVFHVADFDQSQADPAALAMSGFYDRHPMYSRDETITSCVQACFPPHAQIHNPNGLRLCLNTHGLHELDSDVDVHHVIDHEPCIARSLFDLTREALVVCCNPVYDVPRFEALLNRHEFAFTGHYRAVCATGTAATAVGMHPASPNKEIGARLGVDREQFGAAHGALPDALYARALDTAAREYIAELHARAAANA